MVASTRADRADDRTRAVAREEVAEMLAPTRFAGSPIIDVSAETGEGISGFEIWRSQGP